MSPFTRHYTTAATRAATFSFPAWYVRMGYARHGGQKACAEDLGLSDRHVRHLLQGGTPSLTVVRFCRFMEHTLQQLRQLEEKLGIPVQRATLLD